MKQIGIWVLICLIVGVISSVFTVSAIPTWYAGLTKPFFNPPNWVFGPVWTTLYILMGVSAGTIKKTNEFFITQLILNFLWSLIFFNFHLLWVAFFELIILWIFILITIKNFYKKKNVAAYLLLPYFIWVTFAGLLNLSIAMLN